MKAFAPARIVYICVCALLMAGALIPFSPIFAYSGFLYSLPGKLFIASGGLILVGLGVLLPKGWIPKTILSLRRRERTYGVAIATLMAAYVAVVMFQWYLFR